MRGDGKKPLKVSGFAEEEIAVDSEENTLDNDKKIGAREIIRGVSCDDLRKGLVVISVVYVKERCYRIKRHGSEFVWFSNEIKRRKRSLEEEVRRNCLYSEGNVVSALSGRGVCAEYAI